MSKETGKTVGVVDFIRSEPAPMGLFRIAPGVPCDYALEQASTVMGWGRLFSERIRQGDH